MTIEGSILAIYELRIKDQIIQMLVDSRLDTEDVLTVLIPVQDFVGEHIANAKREESPG